MLKHQKTQTIRYDTIRDARLKCNSKAGMSQINLPHGTDNKKMEKQKN